MSNKPGNKNKGGPPKNPWFGDSKLVVNSILGIIGIIVILALIVASSSDVFQKSSPPPPETTTTTPPSSETDVPPPNTPETTTTTPPPETANFLTYENSNLGIKIQYPSNWTKIENITNGFVQFFSPKKGFMDPYTESLSIFLSNSQNMSLDQYVGYNIDSIKRVPEFKIIESSSTILAGNQAQKIVYTGKLTPPSQLDVTVMLIVAVKDNIGYIVNYSSDPEGYIDHLPIIQKMIDSLEISQPVSS